LVRFGHSLYLLEVDQFWNLAVYEQVMTTGNPVELKAEGFHYQYHLTESNVLRSGEYLFEDFFRLCHPLRI